VQLSDKTIKGCWLALTIRPKNLSEMYIMMIMHNDQDNETCVMTVRYLKIW
jgi:hypothetical protein